MVDYVDQYIFEGEHLLIAEDGENLRSRKTPIAFLADGAFWVNNHAHVVRGNEKALTRFLMYSLSITDISGFLTGSTMPKLTQDNLNRIPILTPPISKQKAIVSVLGALDDKIELNHRMNWTLEAIARAIFKSWFLDFDPVWAKAEGRDPGLPKEIADLFPDSFEDSELGPMPQGWRVAMFSDIAEINPRRELDKGSECPYVEMSNMPTTGPRVLRWIGGEFKGSGSRFSNGDVLFARITPCLEHGKTALVDFLSDGLCGFGSTEFLVFGPTAHASSEFLYYLSRTEHVRSYAIGNMTGTSGRQRVPASCLAHLALAMPPSEVVNAFAASVRPLLQAMKVSDDQSAVLAGIRDALLPKLLSGEIGVGGKEANAKKA
jgi:type I restriction enzyme S subunit